MDVTKIFTAENMRKLSLRRGSYTTLCVNSANSLLRGEKA